MVISCTRASTTKKKFRKKNNPALSKVIERNISTITSTFVLISQNRLAEENEHRADLDLQIGLVTEHELTRVLQMLDAIQSKLNIVDHKNSELADLEMETKPEDVLAKIHRIQAIELSYR